MMVIMVNHQGHRTSTHDAFGRKQTGRTILYALHHARCDICRRSVHDDERVSL
jgi:hypothetical protein